MRKYGISRPPMQVRRMRKRWGSCTPQGRIILNLDLIRAPRLCVDYVILHELCHLKHPHHGKAFYRLLDRVMPDWREIKARLRTVRL
jgi:predicted metal-dependent hydrolase